jgi:hypothetical protein
MKRILLLLSFLLLAAVLVIPSVSCVKIVSDDGSGKTSNSKTATSSKKPEIVFFKAEPNTVKPGEQAMLSWQVLNVDKAEISPAVGKVDSNNVALVQPNATTKYVLTAANAAGSVQQELTVTMANVTVQKPDLVLTDLFIQTTTVYMEVKNIGNENAPGSRAAFYINGLQVTNTYVEALRAGESRKVAFDNYNWTYKIPEETPGMEIGALQYTLKACLDVENVVAEANENNNCRSFIYGKQFLYSFYTFAHMALWVSNFGTLTWPMAPGSPNGSAFKQVAMTMEDNLTWGPAVAAYPKPQSDGWIQGRFGDFYVDSMLQSRVRHFKMPSRVHFKAAVGFTSDAPANSKAKFSFIAVDDAATTYVLAEKVCTKDGKLEMFDVDLSDTEGKLRSFVLRVESQDPGGAQGAVWIDPRLEQQMKDP